MQNTISITLPPSQNWSWSPFYRCIPLTLDRSPSASVFLLVVRVHIRVRENVHLPYQPSRPSHLHIACVLHNPNKQDIKHQHKSKPSSPASALVHIYIHVHVQFTYARYWRCVSRSCIHVLLCFGASSLAPGSRLSMLLRPVLASQTWTRSLSDSRRYSILQFCPSVPIWPISTLILG